MVYLKDLAPCQPLAIERAPAALDLDGGGLRSRLGGRPHRIFR